MFANVDVGSRRIIKVDIKVDHVAGQTIVELVWLFGGCAQVGLKRGPVQSVVQTYTKRGVAVAT